MNGVLMCFDFPYRAIKIVDLARTAEINMTSAIGHNREARSHSGRTSGCQEPLTLTIQIATLFTSPETC